MDFNKAHKKIRIILISVPVIFFIFIICKNFIFWGELESVYGFDKNNPVISILKPAGRSLKVEKDEFGDYYQSIIIDPVYFDLYMPTSFKKVELIIKYKTGDEQIVKVGPQVFGGGWNYWLMDLDCDNIVGGWCVSRLEFDITKVFAPNRKINFMISSPELDVSGNKIDITEIKAVLKK